MRNKYWSCGPLADWIRGTCKPAAATGDEWQDWRTRARQQHPLRYWIAEEGLDHVQDLVTWPLQRLHDVRYYINNRWISRAHALTAHAQDIRPGAWCDLSDRILLCLFNELVDYVEVEQAWHNVMWDKEARAKFKPAWYRRWFNIRGWRSRESGLAYLDWASNLRMDETWGVSPGDKDYGKLTVQAKNAQEVKALYLWWTDVYRNRPDAHEASGWNKVCELIRLENDGNLFGAAKDPQLKRQQDRAHRLLQKIEQQYEREDDNMLVRLIKVRRSLWT